MESSNQLMDDVSTTAEVNAKNQSLSKSSGSNGDSIISEHPLLNPVVVDHIVKHLNPDFEQLKTLRLVSKVWTQATHHHWRTSAAVLTLVPDPPYFGKSKYGTGVFISNFVKEFNDPQSSFQLSEKPFSKYKLKDLTLDLEACSDPDSPAFKFWNTVGLLMESVHLYKCLFEKPAGNPNAIICPQVHFLVRMIPNLQHLVLTDMVLTTREAEKYWHNKFPEDEEFYGDEDEIEEVKAFEKGPQSKLRTLTVYGDWKMELNLIQLLMLAPELEVIKGKDQYMRSLLNPINKASHLSVYLRRPPLSKLYHLDLIHSIVMLDQDFPKESEYSPNPVGFQVPPLETLSLHLGAFGEDNENLEIYLKSLPSTLTTFTGLRAPVGPPYSKFLSDTSMTALTELYLMGTIAPHLGFLKSTPNLKKLRIDLGCFEKREMVNGMIKRHNKENREHWMYDKYQDDVVFKVPRALKKEIVCGGLEYFEIDLEFPEESLRMLGNWMPNLKVLKTILNVETVPVVCEIWKELTELVCLHGSKIEDSCFIRRAEQQEVVSFPWSPPKLKICDLEDLERFQLDAYCDECKLTDTVVSEGFLKMPGLKSIEICVNSQMSTEAEEVLRKGIQFCKVVRDNHDECGGSALLGRFVCDRCAFRREVIYGVRDYEDNDYAESEDDSVNYSDSDEDGSFGSSGNSAGSW